MKHRERTNMRAVRAAVPLARAVRATNGAIESNIRAQELAQHAGVSGSAYDAVDSLLYAERADLSGLMTDLLGLDDNEKAQVEDWAAGEVGGRYPSASADGR